MKTLHRTYPTKPPGWSPIGSRGQWSDVHTRVVTLTLQTTMEYIVETWPIEDGAPLWSRITLG